MHYSKQTLFISGESIPFLKATLDIMMTSSSEMPSKREIWLPLILLLTSFRNLSFENLLDSSFGLGMRCYTSLVMSWLLNNSSEAYKNVKSYSSLPHK